MTGDTGGFLPTASQMQFLRACMNEPDEALKAWKEWCATHALGDVNAAQRRLFPLVYQNLQAAGYDGPDMPVLRQAYQQNWFRNELLYHRLDAILHTLGEAGIPVVLLKGIALSTWWYADRHVRAMNDLDLLVPGAQSIEAITLLQQRGWRSFVPVSLLKKRNYTACMLDEGRGYEIDLHWNLIPSNHPDADAELWKRVVSMPYGTSTALTLSPSDHFFHCCIHGYGWNPMHPMRWVVDAYMLWHGSKADIDWDYMVRQARDRHLTLRFRKALEFLDGVRVVEVPGTVFEALRAGPVEQWEHRELAVIATDHCPYVTVLQEKIWVLKWIWFRHRRRCGGSSMPYCLWTYPAILCREVCLDHLWMLPFRVIRITMQLVASEAKALLGMKQSHTGMNG